jgi:hypothetical protein
MLTTCLLKWSSSVHTCRKTKKKTVPCGAPTHQAGNRVSTSARQCPGRGPALHQGRGRQQGEGDNPVPRALPVTIPRASHRVPVAHTAPGPPVPLLLLLLSLHLPTLPPALPLPLLLLPAHGPGQTGQGGAGVLHHKGGALVRVNGEGGGGLAVHRLAAAAVPRPAPQLLEPHLHHVPCPAGGPHVVDCAEQEAVWAHAVPRPAPGPEQHLGLVRVLGTQVEDAVAPERGTVPQAVHQGPHRGLVHLCTRKRTQGQTGRAEGKARSVRDGGEVEDGGRGGASCSRKGSSFLTSSGDWSGLRTCTHTTKCRK